jgi:ribosomal protein S12 methylthiotransferase
MAARLLDAGLAPAGPDDANYLIVNTCGFIGPAEAESTDALTELAGEKRAGQRLIAAGCLAERRGTALADAVPGIDGVLGTRRWAEIGDLIDSFATTPRPTRLGVAPALADPAPRLIGGPSAYVKIADGCNKNCSFCTIPSFKGRQVSRPVGDLLDELEALAAGGVREAVLVAQELGSYGLDLPGAGAGLIDLLGAIQEAPGPDWIRLMYLYPSMLTDELLDAIVGLPRLCNYIDVPVQHSAPAILRAMRRPAGAAEIAGRIRDARQRHPDFAFRTTIIVGFPGETEADFADLCRFVDEASFDHLGAFTYSPEDGTPAATLPDQIAPALQDERYAQLMEIQQRIARRRREARVDAEIDVLVEETFPGPTLDGYQAAGRSRAEAPEIDGRVLLDLPLVAGQIVRARVTAAQPYDLFAAVTGSPDGPLALAAEPDL